MKKILVSLFAFTLALSTAAWAEEGANPGKDKGKDKGEGRPGHPPKFEQMDANGDSSVSLGEFTEAQQERIQQQFRRIDANNDGSLSKGEMEDAREQMKKRMQDRESGKGE